MLLAALASIKLLPLRTTAYDMYPLFYSCLCLVFGINGPRSPAAFKVELFLIKINGQVTTIIIKNSILYMTGILDLPLKNR